MFNEGDPPNIPVNGLVTILVPTSAEVSVSGRVRTASGEAIRNARVELQSSDGKVIAVNSNAFGYYRAGAVPSGSLYFVSVTARGHSFAPRALMIVDSLDNEDVVADP